MIGRDKIAALVFVAGVFTAFTAFGQAVAPVFEENFGGEGRVIGSDGSGVKWDARKLFGDNQGAFFSMPF